MNELALFAGAGGGILGSHLLGFRPVCDVEIEPYCREVLLRRQEEGRLPPFPVWDDVRTFDGKPWRGIVDVVTAGFPCQPFSSAGKQQAENDPRNMWPETIRIIREVGPSRCLLENVPGLISKPYFGTILRQLSEAGFDARWDVVSAADVGAPHLRKRLWIVADAKPKRRRVEAVGRKSLRIGVFPDTNCDVCQWRKECDRCQEASGKTRNRSDPERFCDAVPDADSERLEGRNGCSQKGQGKAEDGSVGPYFRTDEQWWETEPPLGRVVDGMAYRVDQIRAIGNGQVPRVVSEAWRRLT